ncbi:MAG TPA: PAS domain S-box protein [Candidatus Acidoferrales bacterium]|jgi:PAS domain S-box-containing protein|nr:PAS domain S-box protein [Candidatus Acidoferrales bacterium]
MSKPLHILLVEDSEADAELLLAELRFKDFKPVYRRVQSSWELQAALEQHEWDVIISDYYLPQFSGPEALKLVKESKIDVPFIMISGVCGEEVAVQVMKAGADDFVLKSNFSRLAPAIEREMAAAQLRREKVKADTAMRHLAAIVESSEDAIYSKNMDSVIVSWNRAAERIFGYRAEEIIGHSIAKLFPLNQRDELLDIMSAVRRSELVGFKDTYRKRKDGVIIPVSVAISPIKGADGSVVGASTIARDITAKKQAEEERLTLIEDLTKALERVKTLSGLLPICASCKSIRNDGGYWQKVEAYICQHTDVRFTHSICPECSQKYFADFLGEDPAAK